MECEQIDYVENVNDRTIFIVKKLCRKLTSLVYAGLIMCFVPSVMCNTDSPKHLSYEEIYNSTNYAQIQQTARPYLAHSIESYRSDSYKYSNLVDITKGNEVDDEINYKEDEGFSHNGQLLVGFARDPYRYSIPEEDYLKGVRTINPSTYINRGENRGKRGVFHLYNMLYCATGCEPLAYKGYGCYCGFLGEGRPTDGIDRCCKMHDDCYENMYCPFFTVYFQPYYWKCYRGQPLCALENYQTQHQFVNGCAARLCECDRRFAMCVKRYSCPRGRALCRSSPIRLLQNLLMFR